MNAPLTIGETIASIIKEIRDRGDPATTIDLVEGDCIECGSRYSTWTAKGYLGSDLCPMCESVAIAKEQRCATCGLRMSRKVSRTADGYCDPYYSCDHCADPERDEHIRRVHVWQRWKQIVPIDFQTIDPDRLPDRSKLSAVLSFVPDETRIGIFAVGPSYRGKTRCIYERIRLDMMRADRMLSVKVFHPTEFGSEASLYAGENAALKWKQDVASRDIVFFDDLGKEKLTERVESELFGIIDARLSERRTTYFTSNESVSSLTEKFSDAQRAKGIVNRIMGRCLVLNFGPNTGGTAL